MVLFRKSINKNSLMTKITDLVLYRNKVYLELCLDLVEDAYQCIKSGRYDYAESQLKDILDTFDREGIHKAYANGKDNVLTFENTTPPDSEWG